MRVESTLLMYRPWDGLRFAKGRVVLLSALFGLVVSCKTQINLPDSQVHRLSPPAIDAFFADDDDEQNGDDVEQDGGIEDDELEEDAALAVSDFGAAANALPASAAIDGGLVSKADLQAAKPTQNSAAAVVKRSREKAAAETAVRDAVVKIQKELKGCFDRHLEKGVSSEFTLNVHRTGYVTGFSLPGAPPSVKSCVSTLLNRIHIDKMGGAVREREAENRFHAVDRSPLSIPAGVLEFSAEIW